MALIDDIEFYGRLVAAGDMEHPAAVAALVCDSEGGLTKTGAAALIGDWQTARATYRAIGCDDGETVIADDPETYYDRED